MTSAPNTPVDERKFSVGTVAALSVDGVKIEMSDACIVGGHRVYGGLRVGEEHEVETLTGVCSPRRRVR